MDSLLTDAQWTTLYSVTFVVSIVLAIFCILQGAWSDYRHGKR